MREQLRKDYAIDVLLGNTGVAGNEAEHIIVDKDGNAWRVGNGSAMAYDAQGKEKDDEQWGKNCFVDDLWTMTGNGRRIGQPDITSLPLYDGATDVLEMGNAIMEAKTAWEANKSSPLDLLSPKNRAAVEKRLAEIQQLTTRGNHVMKIEAPDSYPRETVLRLLDYSYEMSKDGHREAVKKLKCTRKPETVRIDWLQAPSARKVGGESYDTFGDYLAHKIGDEEYDEIQYANYSQGFDSYMVESCRRKLCIWKNNGFDCTDRQKFPSFRAFLQVVEDAGYFTGRTYEEAFHDKHTGQVALAKAFVGARKNVDAFNKHATAVLKHDAALQLLFENMTIPGFDPKTRTAILVRTEDGKIEGIVDKRSGDRLEHKTGVCESHSHIQAATYIGDTPTAVRVPFHRIHGVWFMERKYRTKQYQYYKGIRVSDEDHQFSAVKQNEIVADTHGLPIILGVGKMGQRKESRKAFDNAIFELETWELGNPTETVLEMLK